MIAWVEQGWIPAGTWNLPAEFEHPGKFALTSDKAQFILEQEGLAGYRGYGAAATRIPTRRVDVHTKANFDHYLDMLRQELARLGETGRMRVEQERRMGGPAGDEPIVNTSYIQRIGTAEYQVAWTQVSDPSSRSGGFYGYVEFAVLGSLERMKRSQFVPTRTRTTAAGAARTTRRTPYRGYGAAAQSPPYPMSRQPFRRRVAGGRATHGGVAVPGPHIAVGGRAPQHLMGYGAANVPPIGWRRFRAIQGRGQGPGGLRGFGRAASWDEYANRLTIP